MKLIVGLGNPGMGYSANRHNIGFLCLNHFAKRCGITLDKKQAHARVGTGVVGGMEVVLARPRTYMNASGLSVVQLMQKYDVNPEDLIVVHDDLDLPLGKIRLRPSSSSGGHKGANSIICALGTQDFIRIRVGIGRPLEPGQTPEETIVDYVLGDFTPEERPVLEDAIRRVSEAIVCLITEGIKAAMNKFN
jgi:peptidyl-tRNA hydrolase, PTH1 family